MGYRKKLGYLKGLAEGLELDSSTKEGKLLLALIDTVDEIVLAIEDREDAIESVEDLVDDLSDDIESLSEAVEDLELEGSADDDDLGGDIRLFHGHGRRDDDEEDDDENVYELSCPGCGHKIVVDEDMLDEGSVICPGCDKALEFEFRCGCGCGDDDCDDRGCCHDHEEDHDKN